MAKFKINRKNAQLHIRSKLDRTEELNTNELQVFNTKLIRGLMMPKAEGKKKIDYTAPIGIPLQKFLKGGISKNDFFLVMAQIVEVTKKIDQYGFNINNLVLNLQYIFINQLTKEVQFIYQPILSRNISSNIFSLLYAVSFATVFRAKEDMRIVDELVGFLRHLQYYTSAELEKYILKVYPEVYQQFQRQKPGQSQILGKNRWTNADNRQPYGDEEEGTVLLEEEGTSLLMEEDDMGTSLLMEEDDMGTSLLEDDMGTSLLMEEDDMGTSLLEDEGTTLFQSGYPNYPYLIRMSNYDRVNIDKPVFRIGKEKRNVDYCVADNNAVSRVHAEIFTNNGGCYIRDHQSTNKTFVNGTLLAAGMDLQLFDGDAIMLANEAFTFHTD